jgi:hypothetical protein
LNVVSSVLVPVGIIAGILSSPFGQQALARDVVDLKPDAVRILKDEKVIAVGPLALHRPAIDVGAHFAQFERGLVDILP